MRELFSSCNRWNSNSRSDFSAFTFTILIICIKLLEALKRLQASIFNRFQFFYLFYLIEQQKNPYNHWNSNGFQDFGTITFTIHIYSIKLPFVPKSLQTLKLLVYSRFFSSSLRTHVFLNVPFLSVASAHAAAVCFLRNC